MFVGDTEHISPRTCFGVSKKCCNSGPRDPEGIFVSRPKRDSVRWVCAVRFGCGFCAERKQERITICLE